MRNMISILILASTGAADAAPVQFCTEDAEVALIFELAEQRLAVMPAVAAVKRQTQAPILDPPREKAVYERAAEIGAPMGLGGDSIQHLFELQARLAREVQTGLHQEWKAHGFSYQGNVTTLAALRPKLDGLTFDILQAVYLAAPVLKRADFESHYAGAARGRRRAAGGAGGGRRGRRAGLH